MMDGLAIGNWRQRDLGVSGAVVDVPFVGVNPSWKSAQISIDKKRQIANLQRFLEILLVKTENLLRAHNSWNVLACRALYMRNFDLTENLFGGVVKIAPFAPVCMYTEEESGVFFIRLGNWQMATGNWRRRKPDGENSTAKT